MAEAVKEKKARVNILHNGKLYKPGDVVGDLKEAEARVLMKSGALVSATGRKANPPKKDGDK